ncbi:MAG TPA: hypothetical protein PKV21_06585 [bacterium]|nr:hypothetical protein [bacterium]
MKPASILTKEVDINTTTPAVIEDMYVQGVNIFSAVAYKISFDGTNYITLPSETAVNFENLDITNFKLYIKAVDTSGKAEVVLLK